MRLLPSFSHVDNETPSHNSLVSHNRDKCAISLPSAKIFWQRDSRCYCRCVSPWNPILKCRPTDSVCSSGAIALLLMICLVCLLMRRRRARGNVGGIGPQPGFVSKPMFGGPWNRSNVVPPQNGAPTSPYIHHGNPNSSQAPSQSYNPEYPPRNTSLPPPAYGKDAEYKGEYQPVRVFYISTF